MSNNVSDELWNRVNYYDTNIIVSLTDYLRPRHLSIFHEPPIPYIGTPLTEHYHTVQSAECLGWIDSVRVIDAPGRPGYHLQGWGWDRRSQTSPHRLVLADGAQRIIGDTISGMPRADVVSSLHDDRAGHAGWVGYVSGLNGRQKIDAYTILPGYRGVCLVGTIMAPTRR